VLPLQFVRRYIPKNGLPAINPAAMEIKPGMRVRDFKSQELRLTVDANWDRLKE
jgi:hypothetical protein